MTANRPQAPLPSLVWPMRLTLIGLWAERLARAFWPLWSLVLAVVAAAAFGLQDLGPLRGAQAVGAGILLLGLGLLALGLRRFRKPGPLDALERLDSAMPGRPIAALRDTQTIGVGDAASRSVWEAHKSRMAARAAAAQPVAPDLRLSSRDPFSLRYVALTAFVMALLFGSLWRAASVAGLGPGAAVAMPGGPAWEAWAEPPAYTGKPSLYLNEITAGTIELPVGSQLQIRLYGPEGTLAVVQTVADMPPETETPKTDTPEAAAADAPPEGMAGVQDLIVTRSGNLAIEGPGGREWQIILMPDALPTIAVSGDMTREADGRFKQGFTATDDYGVVAGRVTIALDLGSIDRIHGLIPDPEAVEPVVLDLPMPLSGDRDDITETLVDDLSKHVFANLPVTMVFAAVDAAGQEGTSAPYAVTLPGKRFFDPLAAALIEMRRDLLWNRINAPRAVQILKAVTHAPEGFIRHDRAFLRLRVMMRELESKKVSLSVEERDELAEELWTIALMVEEGNLQSALERLQRAQDRLQEAIENGASPEEIEQLMREMQQALNEYTRELGEEAQRNPEGEQPGMEGMQLSADQLQQLMDELQRLMEEGKTAEAAELMEQIRQFMENMQVVEGEGGQGQGAPGQPGMQELGETLRDQQELSDDAYRDMQEGQGQGQNPDIGDQEPGGTGEGTEDGQGGSGDTPGTLTDRQRALRERLDELRSGELPGDGSEAGEEGRRNLERAERAMEEAEDALERGDLDGALDRQAEAMDAIRDGMQDFGRALAEEQRDRQPGDGERRTDEGGGADPLGRESPDNGAENFDPNAALGDGPGEPGARAQELLDELRRRAGEMGRPSEELDYLKRLLQVF